MFEVAGLTRSFGAPTVVANVATAVAGGACPGVMGPNGTGKSTVFDLWAGVTRADAGQVRIDGINGFALPHGARACALVRRYGQPRSIPDVERFPFLTASDKVCINTG